MIYVLRLVHVLAGVFWVGAALFTAFFLAPSLRAAGPAAGPVMQQIAPVRRLPLYMITGMALTILSGISLYWRASGGFSNGWMGTGPGMAFGTGGALAILAGLIGVTVASPAARRSGALAAAMGKAGGPPSAEQAAEMQRLQRRMALGMTLVAWLLLLATAAMAVARYIP